VEELKEGKDEMNLAEFPLSLLADRAGPDQRSLCFEDSVWDEGRRERITRQLMVTASEKHGLPTALDDEVLLGLVQLSKQRNFEDRKVPFTRYQLVELLGWREEGRSYARLEESLLRWVGVTLHYRNAWWSREEQSWVDETFHVLDNVTLLDRERVARKRKQDALPLSQFIWNDVLFRSFQSGNLKALDFEFYRSLESSVARRLYRFLDKRFFHTKRWEFDLKELACTHVGLSRNYDTANLKRKLLPGLVELEEKGFLASRSERFRRVSTGRWLVTIESARTKKVEVPETVRWLTERGVTAATAQSLVAAIPLERIRHHVETFDWLVSKKDARALRNAPGFLASSIRDDYAAPQGFVSKAEREERAKTDRVSKQEKDADKKRTEASEAEAARAESEAFDRAWNALTASEQTRLEQQALASSNRIQRAVLARGGAFAEATRRTLLKRLLRQSPAAESRRSPPGTPRLPG
jgi:hypothetical protein